MINFNNAKFLRSVGNLNQIKENYKNQVVFSGRSNVGKSSLINKLLNRKSLARVSNKPGKTININFYEVDKINFVDLPGYGYAKVSFDEKKRWSKLIEGYFDNNLNISLVVQIIDMRHEPSLLDIQMMDFLKSRGYPFVIVASKCDKLNKTEKAKREELMARELEDYEDIRKIIFSSVTSQGLDELKGVICEHCKKN